MENNNCGVIYIVTIHESPVYLKAAIASARSVRKFSPSIGIHVFTDSRGLDDLKSLIDFPFDSTGLIENPHYRSKVDYMTRSPFERTLYLDSDTIVVDDITGLFDLLDRFDVALVHAHNRNCYKTSQCWIINIPDSFPQYNSGVFLYKNSQAVISLLKRWRESFHHAGFKKDQVTLRELLWSSDLRVATLPPEYNIRHEKYIRLWKRSRKEAKPKILHMAKFHHKNKFIYMMKKAKRRIFERLGL